MSDTWLPDPKETPPMPAVKRARAELLMPENYLEVGLSPDERDVVINHPAAVRQGFIVFSPAQARALAKLLLRKADECKS